MIVLQSTGVTVGATSNFFDTVPLAPASGFGATGIGYAQFNSITVGSTGTYQAGFAITTDPGSAGITTTQVINATRISAGVSINYSSTLVNQQSRQITALFLLQANDSINFTLQPVQSIGLLGNTTSPVTYAWLQRIV